MDRSIICILLFICLVVSLLDQLAGTTPPYLIMMEETRWLPHQLTPSVSKLTLKAVQNVVRLYDGDWGACAYMVCRL